MCTVTAYRALYQYENWQEYLPDENLEVPEVATAQEQLAAERESGIRPVENGLYGARTDFVPPTPVEPEVPGHVVPVYDMDSGAAMGLGFVTADGEAKLTARMTDVDTIYSHTDGFHIGRSALDLFAKQATADETATFETLDLQELAAQFPSRDDWIAAHGPFSTWDAWSRGEPIFETELAFTDTTAEVPAETDNAVDDSAEAVVEESYSPLYAQALLNAPLFAAL